MRVDPSFDKLKQMYSSFGHLKFDFRNVNLYSLLVSYLKKLTVLDIGSGPGHFLYFAQQQGFEVTGLEPNEDLIKLAEELYDGLSQNMQNVFAENISEVKGSYDNVSLIDVLEHIEDDVRLLKGIPKLLNPDGQLIILVPCFPHLYGVRDKSIGHYRRYKKSELIRKLTECGFEVLSIRYWNMLGYLPYFISEKVFKKPISVKLRTQDESSTGFKHYLNKGLYLWFKYIENHVDFGFGLSLLCVAKCKIKKSSG